MNKAFGKVCVALANVCWLLSSMPGWLAFLIASRRVKRAQLSLLRRILKQNAATEFGEHHRFAELSKVADFRAVPLSEYEDYADLVDKLKAGESSVLTRDSVELLQPTSGSTAATKLIPYTKTLRDQFKAAVDPWIASMYLAHPSLLGGRHYWSISPTTAYPADSEAKVKIGFADDAEYLGKIQRWLSRALLVMPPEISQVTDHDAFEYLTLLFLCREKNLRVISVWHPSFLTVLLKVIPERLPSIVRDLENGAVGDSVKLNAELRGKFNERLRADAKRAEELGRLDVSSSDGLGALWPKLRVISCWTDGIAEPWLGELKRCFPQATIQGKGLTATEGIVSFPYGKVGGAVCAVGSHFLEFVEPETGKLFCAWELEEGREYGVVLTTGGGLYRYRLHDVVRVTGFFRQAPCLKFIARDNLVSDLVGEKLNGRHVEESVRSVEQQLGMRFRFALLAPLAEEGGAGYVLYAQLGEAAAPDFQQVALLLDVELQLNYHYRHARGLSQLEPVKVFLIAESEDAGVIYRRHFVAKGVKPGELKINALAVDRTWSEEFTGEFVA